MFYRRTIYFSLSLKPTDQNICFYTIHPIYQSVMWHLILIQSLYWFYKGNDLWASIVFFPNTYIPSPFFNKLGDFFHLFPPYSFTHYLHREEANLNVTLALVFLKWNIRALAENVHNNRHFIIRVMICYIYSRNSKFISSYIPLPCLHIA